jgi:SAM-dependent methyltransferase
MHAHSSAPSPWITRFAHLVRSGGRVLDVACGAGRHARFFAERGCAVLAVDRDRELLSGLDDRPGVTPRVADLEAGAWPFGAERFDAIVVANYLHRPLLPHLVAALTHDGALLYETFAVGNAAFGKPANPDFLLEPGELLEAFGTTMTVVAFEQGEVQGTDRNAVVQRLAAVGRARPWPPLLGDLS